MPLGRHHRPLLPIARQQALVAELLDLGPTTWLPLKAGSTSAVYRALEHRLVFRFSRTPHRRDLLVSHVSRAQALVAAGVPFAFPAVGEPLTFIDPDRDDSPLAAVTVWHDLGTGHTLNYEEFGHALGLLHDDGTRALADDTALGVVSDFDHMRSRLEKASRRGLLSGAEHDVLASWVERMEAMHPGHPHEDSDAVVLVHDDVWPKNVVQTPHGAHLLDPDNLAWGTREHDLAFLARAHDTGLIDDEALRGFQRGYGQLVPTPDTAWAHAYVHRMRWVLNLIETRDQTEPARMLGTELPLWSLPRGPRDEPAGC